MRIPRIPFKKITFFYQGSFSKRKVKSYSFEFQSKINLINETDYENKIENLVNDLNSALCGAADTALTKTRINTKLSTPRKADNNDSDILQ
jgi:hypothetical protein